LALGRGGKLSRSKGSGDLGSLAAKQLCSLEDSVFPSTNGRGIKAAFTLAEVLITLGIIGVVAAMTLPALIQNYQKGVALNRLKQSYAQVQTAVDTVASRDFDGLPLHQWSCDGQTKFSGIRSWGTRSGDSCFYLAIQEIAVKMYPQPDSIEHAMCYEEGREYRPYTCLNGDSSCFQDGKMISSSGISALLPNGACVRWHWAAWAGDARGSLLIDVDGPYAGYNRLGKDVFRFRYSVADLVTGFGNNGRTIIPYWQGDTRARLSSGCKKQAKGDSCAALIMNDGWQMKSDYPW